MHELDSVSSASKALPSDRTTGFEVESIPISRDSGKTTLGGVQVGSPLVHGALLNSFRDGILANGMVALNDTFGIAAAIALRASAMGISLLSALPMLIGSIAQYLLPAWTDPAKGRKVYVLRGVWGQALFLFLAGFAGWLPPRWAPWAYIFLFVSASISANLTGPFWVAWMGDLVPASARGRHFAWRSVFFSWMYLSCCLTAGIVSRRYGNRNAPWILFACVFIGAALLRSGSGLFLSRQYEPAATLAPKAFSPLGFRPGREFLIYCVATGLFQGAASMSGPFFNVWYLRDLHFSYLFLSIGLSLTVFGSIVFSGFWGRLADRQGTGRVLWISGLLVAVVPFPYVFFHDRWIIWLCCFYSGATWGGYNLANFNHMLKATESGHRSHFIAFASLVVGLTGCAFSLLGGFLATRLPIVSGWRLQSLFLLSGVLRILVFLAFFAKFREHREPVPQSVQDLYRELPGFRIGAGLARGLFRGFRGV